jgi:hypothetical protein
MPLSTLARAWTHKRVSGDTSKAIAGELVIAGGDTSAFFDLAEEPLVTRPVEIATDGVDFAGKSASPATNVLPTIFPFSARHVHVGAGRAMDVSIIRAAVVSIAQPFMIGSQMPAPPVSHPAPSIPMYRQHYRSCNRFAFVVA